MSTRTAPDSSADWAAPGYAEQRELGHGASGRVVEAVEEATGRRVAIKYLSPELVQDPAFLPRFHDQVLRLTELDVPPVVRIFDFKEQPGQGAAVVMELVNGVSLSSMIERQGKLGPEAALAVLKASLLGLGAVHRLGFGHRDFKPANVLVDATGQIKLTDFGLAIRASEEVPVVGTPLYMAPERWRGEPATTATDVYAATAVFFECLTGQPPFSGDILQLQEQHADAPVALDQVEPPLRDLVEQGLAKERAGRPHSAIAFVSELEAMAATAYGPDWEMRGSTELAQRAAALLPPHAGHPGHGALLGHGGRGGRGGGAVAGAISGQAGGRRRIVAIAAIAAVLVIALGTVATAVTLSGGHHQASLTGVSSGAGATTPSIQAVADVTPPAAASKCDSPTAFSYSATLSASRPGTVKYRWVYSSGQQGPVKTMSFASPGRRLITGQTLKASRAGGGWGEVKLLSPVAATSDKATYNLLCGGTGGITATAAVQPATRKVNCTKATPAFTANGSITADKAEKVKYYWAQSDGAHSAPGTVTFSKPGPQAVAPLTITPEAVSGSGEAVLVVTSPHAATSGPAAYTLTCSVLAGQPSASATRPATSLALSATASVTPASQSLTSCSAAAPNFTFTGTITNSKASTVSYHWQLPSGSGPTNTLKFSRAGTQTVSTTYTPGSDSASGAGTLVVSGAGSASSNAATFTVTCGQALAVTNDAPTVAQSGQGYKGTVTVSGGSGKYTWAVSGLPRGLSANGAGSTLTISGDPDKAGTFTAAVTVRDSSAPAKKGTASFTLTVTDPPLAISGYLAAAKLGQGYSATLTGSGGNGSYTWARVSGLPSGLAATPSGNALTISGTPAASGNFSVAVSLRDTESPAQKARASLTLAVSAPALQVTTTGLPSGTEDSGYDAFASATGGDGSYTWSASGLPDGLSIDPGSGEISGTPAAAGTFRVKLAAIDASGQRDTASASLTIEQAAANPPPPPGPGPGPGPGPAGPGPN